VIREIDERPGSKKERQSDHRRGDSKDPRKGRKGMVIIEEGMVMII
jgi:hypothetical protein